MRPTERANEIAASILALAVGSTVTFALLLGAFDVAPKVASLLGLTGNRDAFGLLAAMALVWTCERLEASERFEKLRSLIEDQVGGRDNPLA